MERDPTLEARADAGGSQATARAFRDERRLPPAVAENGRRKVLRADALYGRLGPAPRFPRGAPFDAPTLHRRG